MPRFISRQRPRLTALLLPAVLLAFGITFGSRPASAKPNGGYLWEKIHVTQQLPTAIFARLGLTHSTRNGLTRDGKKDVPDPTFPAGMTDIVPYDAEKLFIIRGTAAGRASFRGRVQAADVPIPPVSLHAELARRTDGTEKPLGTTDLNSMADRRPTVLTLGDGAASRVYEITTRQNADGTLWVACRIGLPLPPPPTGDAGAVFVPTQVWTTPLSKRIRPGETAVFEDLASFRQAAIRKLGLSQSDTPDDYVLRLTPTLATAAP